LPFVEYTAGRLLARNRTWYANLRMLVDARARSSPFARDPAPWSEVVAHRDQRLRDILRRLRELMYESS
jgi:hypothetical protein